MVFNRKRNLTKPIKPKKHDETKNKGKNETIFSKHQTTKFVFF